MASTDAFRHLANQVSNCTREYWLAYKAYISHINIQLFEQCEAWYHCHAKMTTNCNQVDEQSKSDRKKLSLADWGSFMSGGWPWSEMEYIYTLRTCGYLWRQCPIAINPLCEIYTNNKFLPLKGVTIQGWILRCTACTPLHRSYILLYIEGVVSKRVAT